MEFPKKDFEFAIIYEKDSTYFSFQKLNQLLKSLESEINCKITLHQIEVSEISSKLSSIKNLDMITCIPKNVNSLLLVLDKFPNITWVHSMFSGVDKFLQCPKIMNNPKITLTNARGAYSDPLAEYTILSMLYFNYNIPTYFQCMNEHNWNKLTNTMVNEKTICIIGYGKNGIAIAKRVKPAFNMKVIGLVRKYRDNIEGKEFCDELYGFDKFEKDIINKADFILATLPETNETKNIFNKKFFGWMKKDAVFINIGRGSAVVEEDLIEALNNDTIRGAVLDVCQHEPLDKDDKLYDVPKSKLLITNHSGDVTTMYADHSYKPLIDNIRSFILKGELITIVKKDLGY